jgi:hypothetical protein
MKAFKGKSTGHSRFRKGITIGRISNRFSKSLGKKKLEKEIHGRVSALKNYCRLGARAQVCNPSFVGGGDREDHGSRTASAKSL